MHSTKGNKQKVIKVFLGVLLILLGLYIDVSQKGVMLDKLLPFYYWIRNVGRSIGLSYMRALNLISGSFGVMLTVTNIIITITVNMANRAENYVLGFSREEINFRDSKNVENYKRIWVICAPFVLMFTLNINFCVLSYVTMLLSYCCVMSTFRVFFNSYDSEKDVEIVIDRLTEAIKTIKQNNSVEYELFLRKLMKGTEKDDYWDKITQITKSLVDEAEKLESKISFKAVYCFFSIVIISRMKEQNENYLKVVEDIINYLDIKLVTVEKEDLEQIEIIFGAIFFSLSNLTSEEEISSMLDIILNRSERSNWLIKQIHKSLSLDLYEKELGLLLIIMETWSNGCSKIENSNLKSHFIKLWQGGKKYLGNGYEKQVDLFSILWEDQLYSKSRILHRIGTVKDSVKLLRDTSNKKMEGSIIFSVWKRAD